MAGKTVQTAGSFYSMYHTSKKQVCQFGRLYGKMLLCKKYHKGWI